MIFKPWYRRSSKRFFQKYFFNKIYLLENRAPWGYVCRASSPWSWLIINWFQLFANHNSNQEMCLRL